MRFLRILMAGGPLLLYLSVGSCVAPPLHDQIVSPGRDHGNNTNWNDEDASSRFIVFPPTLFFSNYSSKKYAHLPTIYARADRAFKNKPWRTKKEIYYKGKREIYYKAKDCKIYLLHEEGRLLGKGGFGSVHEALDLTTNESIALKIVAAYQSMTRMQKEWTCLKIMDAAVGDYIIGKTWKAVPMKLFKGRSLKHELLAVDHQQHNAFNLTQLYLRAQQQIHLLHSKGYYHGDAHPGNFIIHPEDGAVNMIDFGFCDKLKHNKNGPAFTDFRTLATRIIHELQFFHSFSLTTPLAEGQSQVVRLAESDIDLINDGIFPKINI